MTDFADNFPLFIRTEEDIRAEWDARVNQGLNPDDPDYVDTREGLPYHMATQPLVIAFAQAYDRANEILAAAILETSWEQALDNHAASFKMERKAATYATGSVTFVGDEGTLIGAGARVGVEQTDPDQDPQEFEATLGGAIPAPVAPATMGVLTLPVQAVSEGAVGNVASGAITLPISALPGVSSLSNIDEISNGFDVESDPQLKTRIKARFDSGGRGTQGWYLQQALDWPGVGGATVIPGWNGPDSVQVILLDMNRNPVAAQVISDFQAYIDPVPGQGHGAAPVDHVVTTQTPASVQISVSAVVTFKSGYGYDPGAGLIAIRTQIEDVLNEYIDGLDPGDDVIYDAVKAQFFKVDGVLDVANVLVNGAAVDIVITSDPPQVAQPNTITLT